MKWMIHGAAVLTLDDDDRFWPQGDIVIADDRIQALGPDLSAERGSVEGVLDARGQIAIPGLINAHLHSHDRFDKGRFDNVPLEIWMALYNPPLGKRSWTPREAYCRTLLNAMEMLKTGTTTVMDDVVHGAFSEEVIDAVFQAYEDIGMRARVSIAYSDRPYFQTIPYLEELMPDPLKEELSRLAASFRPEEVLSLWRRYARRWCGRVGFFLSPSAPMRCTDGFLKKTWALSEEFDLPVVVHFLETKVQVVTSRLFYGKSLAEHLQALGVLTPRSALVHAVWASDRDLDRIQSAQASIIHNPVSNAKLGSGIAPIRQMLDRGIAVGLGTDNNNANDSANLLEAMKLAALLHKLRDFDYRRWVGAKEALWMATKGSARCARLEKEVGCLAVGRKADIVLLNRKTPSFFPTHHLVRQIVFCETGMSVDTVVVDGKIIVEKGRIRTVDEGKIFQELWAQEEALKEKIRNWAQRGPELEPYVREAYFRCVQQDPISEP